MLIVRGTPWDAKVLGVTTEEIAGTELDFCTELDFYEARCVQLGVGFTSARIEASDAAARIALEEAGYHQVGTYVRTRGKLAFYPPDGVTLRKATPADSLALRAIVAGWPGFGPFFDDRRISQMAARQRMCNRVDTLLRDARVLVHEDTNGIVAFFAYTLEGTVAELVLAGLALGTPRQLRGRVFWTAVLGEIYRAGGQVGEGTLSVTNLGALNIYAALGFRFTHTYLQYHRHRT